MNNDRLLTRVWDKQEKKMRYPYTSFKYDKKLRYCLYGVTEKGIIVQDLEDHTLAIIPFGDRFIPMMCQGWNDKNGKLIWEADIINDDLGTGVITLHEKSNYLKIIYPKQNLGKWFKDFLESEKKNIEIIGNKFEQPELMNLEVKG